MRFFWFFWLILKGFKLNKLKLLLVRVVYVILKCRKEKISYELVEIRFVKKKILIIKGVINCVFFLYF